MSFTPPAEWETFKRAPGLVLGYHGCDRSTGERVLGGEVRHLHVSRNPYDWLGDGIYFWEADPWRAFKFAEDAVENRHLTKGVITKPYVVGAIIDLGFCLNLSEINALEEVKAAYDFLESAARAVDPALLPANKGMEMGARFRDRAVIEAVHSLRRKRGKTPYESARAPFLEGKQLYQNAGFREKNHIQIAVRETRCIRGYFRLPGM